MDMYMPGSNDTENKTEEKDTKEEKEDPVTCKLKELASKMDDSSKSYILIESLMMMNKDIQSLKAEDMKEGEL